MKNWPTISLLLLAPLAVALLLTSCNHKTATLKLVINGPYAICEQDPRHLLILMPDLTPTGEPRDKLGHWPPGFIADLSETSLDREKYGYGKDFELQLGRAGAKSPKVSASTVTVDSAVYPVSIDSVADQAPCNPRHDEYISLVMPMPDDIVTIGPVKVSLMHEDNVPHNGLYATKAIFVYDSVRLDKVAVYGNAPSDHGESVWTKIWPRTNSAPFVSLNGDTVLTFDSLRRLDSDEEHHDHARNANDKMCVMINKTRQLCYSDEECAKGTLDKGGIMHALGGAHGDCLSPQLIVCQSGSALCASLGH